MTFIVWHLIPLSVLYWCVARAGAIATTEFHTNKTPHEIDILDLMKCVDAKRTGAAVS